MSIYLQHAAGTTEDTSNVHVIDEDEDLNEFKVYMPKKCDPKKVLLVLSGSEIEMSKSRESHKLWLATVRVKPKRDYQYCVLTTASRLGPIGNLPGLSSLSARKTDQRTEDRKMQQCLTHRNIFQQLEMTQEEHSNACKMYMAEIIKQIGNCEDLHCAVHECCEFIDFTNVTGREASAVAASAEFVSNSYAANFVCYCILRLEHSTPDSNVSLESIESKHAALLLNFLRDAGLERSIFQSQDFSVCDVMISLVKAATSKKASWQFFVDTCYPTLAAVEILLAKDKQWYHDDQLRGRLVTKLCKSVGSDENSEKLLFSVINDIKSLEVFCDALKICKDAVPTTYCEIVTKEGLKEKFKKWVSERITHCSKIHCLRELYAKLCDVDQDLLKYVADEFQEKILAIMKSSSRVEREDCFVELALCPHLFVETSAAKTLLNSIKHDRQCLCLLLKPQKFGKIFDHEDMKTFIYDWLKNEFKESEKQRLLVSYQCMWEITSIQYLKENDKMMIDVQHKILNHLSDSLRKCSHHSDLSVIGDILKQVHPEAITTFDQSDLEDAVIRIVKHCAKSSFNTEFLPMFVENVLSDKLFTKYDKATQLLKHVIQSEDRAIHNSFLDIMKDAKFWAVIREGGDCEILFRRWIEVAHDVHCKRKAAQIKQCTSTYQVMYLYEYVSDSISKVFVCNNYPNIQQLLEDTAVAHCADLDPVAVFDMLMTVSEVSDSAKELLYNHLESKSFHTTLSNEDMNMRFKELFERRESEGEKEFFKR